jgi:cyanate lyase
MTQCLCWMACPWDSWIHERDVVMPLRGAATEEPDEVAADLGLHGDAVDLIEMLSVRQPFNQSIPAEADWMLRGITEIFDLEC